ncbi:MAG: exodeoxyribonuclease VII small subunit [Myxococcales bacterium]|nr:exodeoxyribonuclease VII small subunit [Myxococcales bacterium]
MSAEEPFEETLRRLTEIVKKLEEGDLSLEESLRAFEQGVSLTRAAKARLAAAQTRVDELLAVDEQGRASTREGA